MSRPSPWACSEVGDLGVHGPAWDRLVAASDLPTPFLRRWWLDATATPRRRYVLVTDGDGLVGGVALERDRLAGVVRYRCAAQGTLCPDHLDVLAAPGRRAEVEEALGAWWRDGTHLLDADGLVAGSALARITGGTGRPLDVAPYDALPGSGEEWMQRRSSSFRRSVRRSTSRLSASGLRVRRVEPADLGAALDAFTDLHADREGREALVALTDTLRRALGPALEAGEAWVHVLGSEEETAAVSLAFVVAGRLSLYQVARSTRPEHDGAGTALLAHVVAEAADLGVDEVDLLRGGEGYKASFVTASREVHRLRVGHGLRARVVVALLEHAVLLRRRVRRLRTGRGAATSPPPPRA